ncbi:MAG TPA: universal stress protein [Verrucomicrobiae bacterium]|nr:universal stress protein [Verrucomicrobiae bacterium]
MITVSTNRPRNVDAPRAAAILYGDWGTSKAYVIGLAFAVAGYSSFWLIAAMCVLTALVGVNYMIICRHYPDGGGVYASVRHRSEVISIVGAFLLVADYLVTASISALSAFQYLGVPHPEQFAAGAILVIGALNFFGPRHTGGLAFLVAIPAMLVVVILGAFCVPHLAAAWHNVQPLSGGFGQNWKGFVSIVLALSGVEAIANATGVMRLNPAASNGKPSVSKTSTPAIIAVMIEVCLFTALLGLAMHALSGLTIHGEGVDAPGSRGVRDYMLRYMADVFVGHSLGIAAGHAAAWAVSVVIGLLLLSAVNTAIVDLIAIQYLMSRDGEMPSVFQRLNRFGVPKFAILVATAIPVALVLIVKDMSGLADLYAIGVVGAIAANLGSTSTDKKIDLLVWERGLMLATFLVMAAIEASLFWDKPHARVFAVTVLAIGLVLRGLASEHSRRNKVAKPPPDRAVTPVAPVPVEISTSLSSREPLLCAVRRIGRTLDFAIEEAAETGRKLYLLYLREQAVVTADDRRRPWEDDPVAKEIFGYAKSKSRELVVPCYAVTDAPASTIVDLAATFGAGRLILGASDRTGILKLLRGNIVREVADSLPENIQLVVCG